MARGSEFASDICQVCADICEACGAECAKHSHPHCQACAQACDRCAQECRQMAGGQGQRRSSSSRTQPTQ
jgi:hypothetical protein